MGKSHFPITDDENLLLYYLGWFMSGRMRFMAQDYNNSYQDDPICQKAYILIEQEFGYTYQNIWDL